MNAKIKKQSITLRRHRHSSIGLYQIEALKNLTAVYVPAKNGQDRIVYAGDVINEAEAAFLCSRENIDVNVTV